MNSQALLVEANAARIRAVTLHVPAGVASPPRRVEPGFTIIDKESVKDPAFARCVYQAPATPAQPFWRTRLEAGADPRRASKRAEILTSSSSTCSPPRPPVSLAFSTLRYTAGSAVIGDPLLLSSIAVVIIGGVSMIAGMAASGAATAHVVQAQSAQARRLAPRRSKPRSPPRGASRGLHR